MLKRLTFTLILLTSAALAQTSVAPLDNPKFQFLSSAGVPLAGGKVCTFQSGTATPLTTYSESTGTSANTNPITLDSGGFATIFVTSSAIKLIVYSSVGADSNCPNAGVPQYTVDGIAPAKPVAPLSLTAITDPAPSLGLFWLSLTNPGFLKWSDASAIHTIVGADSTQTLTNKTLTSPGITNPTITGTDSGAETFSGVKTFTAQPLNSQGGNIAGIMTGTCSGVASPSTTLALFPLGEISALTCTVAPLGGNGAGAMMTTAGTVKNLQVICSGGTGVNASSGVFTVLKNNIATTVTCTIGTGSSCGDSTHSFNGVAGDRIGIQFTTQALETLASCSASIERF